ncbi:MAG: hypothetical protein KDD43_16760 [Bdellovibrionales bacterium]|nr:hypothetical protein [Bdellovibrionales bacterium]
MLSFLINISCRDCKDGMLVVAVAVAFVVAVVFEDEGDPFDRGCTFLVLADTLFSDTTPEGHQQVGMFLKIEKQSFSS